MSLFDDVGEFHRKFNLPVAGETRLGFPSHAEVKYRLRFMQEELAEFVEAYGANDLPKAADAIADLVWVALGTAHYFGVPFDRIWNEVKRANLEKRPWREGDPAKPRNIITAVEVVKPEGWREPDVRGIIARYKIEGGWL